MDEDHVRAAYIGRDLRDIPGPQAVIDRIIVQKNCASMLRAADSLDVGFRSHIKTHKTAELARIQVGNSSNAVNLIISTIPEARILMPLLLEWQKAGREINVLYGIPPSSQCGREIKPMRDELGPLSFSFLIDNPAQLQNLSELCKEDMSDPIPIMLKADSGYHRAGLLPDGISFVNLVEEVAACKHVTLQGIYSHNSLSYNGSSPTDALQFLEAELQTVLAAANKAALHFPTQSRKFVLSVGATPSATAAQNLLASDGDATVQRLGELIKSIKTLYKVELHAGVYSVLDMQQLATHARPTTHGQTPTMTHLSLIHI